MKDGYVFYLNPEKYIFPMNFYKIIKNRKIIGEKWIRN